MICNIIKTVMPLIISRTQSAFIPSRLITDNIMVVAYELLHSMKLNKKKKEGLLAINLDMSKVYNRIEWPYLRAIMAIMGFTKHWIRLIIICVTPIHYSVLVNCSPRETFTHSRCMRQNDPLSPYLFHLCVECLSSLMNKAEGQGELKGLGVARGGTQINQLIFANNYVLFGRAYREEWLKMEYILTT